MKKKPHFTHLNGSFSVRDLELGFTKCRKQSRLMPSERQNPTRNFNKCPAATLTYDAAVFALQSGGGAVGGGSRAAPGRGSSSSSRSWAFNRATEEPTGVGAGAALW